MRIFALRNSALRIFSFAATGIARRHSATGSHACLRRHLGRRHESLLLGSERLEGRVLLASGFDLINGVAVPAAVSSLQDAGSRATPVSSIQVELANPSKTLDDFELFYSPGGGGAGKVIDLTPPTEPPTATPVPSIHPTGTTKKYQIDFLSDYTKDPGTYIFRVANPAVDSSFAVTWVMTTTTPGALTATMLQAPDDPTSATPRSTPVDSVTVTFTENVRNVDIAHFRLLKNGVAVEAFSKAATLSGSGDTYVVNGLSAFNGTPGTYQLIMSPSFTVGETTTSIETFAGGKLLAAKSAVWTYAPIVAVAGVTPPAEQAYETGDKLAFSVRFDEAVIVTGSPTLAFTIGGAARQATLTTASIAAAVAPNGNDTLDFEYTIDTADSTITGVSVTGITLAGGTIKDAAGNNANLAFTAVLVTGIVVNRTFLQSVALTSTDNKSYRVGEFIEFTATFSLPVLVTGLPTLPLTIGTAAKTASYINGSGTNQLKFRYTVVANDLDTDGIEFAGTVVGLATATITNKGVTADISFTPPDISGVKVDGTTPILTSVTGPAAGVYAEGSSLQFVATFNKSMRVTPGPVVPPAVTGSLPRIAMVVGTTTRYATYVAGDETPVLVFEYKVAAGILTPTASSQARSFSSTAGSSLICPAIAAA